MNKGSPVRNIRQKGVSGEIRFVRSVTGATVREPAPAIESGTAPESPTHLYSYPTSQTHLYLYRTPTSSHPEGYFNYIKTKGDFF